MTYHDTILRLVELLMIEKDNNLKLQLEIQKQQYEQKEQQTETMK